MMMMTMMKLLLHWILQRMTTITILPLKVKNRLVRH